MLTSDQLKQLEKNVFYELKIDNRWKVKQDDGRLTIGRYGCTPLEAEEIEAISKIKIIKFFEVFRELENLMEAVQSIPKTPVLDDLHYAPMRDQN